MQLIESTGKVCVISDVCRDYKFPELGAQDRRPVGVCTNFGTVCVIGE